jgi:DNA invertase Pin-like site-specific DNA recombinase
VGGRDDRPGYTELLRQVHQTRARGGPAAIVVAALDRLGRRLVESVRVHADLRTLGVEIHAVREGGVLPDLLMNVLSAVAEEEVQRISRRIAAVRGRQVANGWYVANRLPYGYLWRAATPEERAALAPRLVPEIDPDAADCVRVLFERAARGEKLHTLLATASGSREQQQELGRWIGHLLRTPTYVARPCKGDRDVLSRPLSRWPPLVDDATWEQVQMRFARRSYARLAIGPRAASPSSQCSAR